MRALPESGELIFLPPLLRLSRNKEHDESSGT